MQTNAIKITQKLNIKKEIYQLAAVAAAVVAAAAIAVIVVAEAVVIQKAVKAVKAIVLETIPKKNIIHLSLAIITKTNSLLIMNQWKENIILLMIIIILIKAIRIKGLKNIKKKETTKTIIIFIILSHNKSKKN